MTERTTIIYHGGCLDGVAAAACVGESLGWDRVECWAGFHDGQTPPASLVDGRHLVIVDYSFRRQVIGDLASRAKSLVLLDHHASAKQELAGGVGGAAIHIDEERSGCGLAWDYYLPGGRLKIGCAAITHIEDGDLWRWELPCSREVYAALQTWPKDDPKAFADLIFRQPWPGLEILAAQGAALIGARNARIGRALALARHVELFGLPCALVAVGDPADRSDLGAALLEQDEGAELAALWWSVGEGQLQVSLRSLPDGVDVARLALAMGGGGHSRAAGFTVEVDRVFSEPKLRRAFFGGE